MMMQGFMLQARSLARISSARKGDRIPFWAVRVCLRLAIGTELLATDSARPTLGDKVACKRS